MFSKGIKRKAAGHKETFAKLPFLPDLWVILRISTICTPRAFPAGHLG
jgi:hypothetical protein